MGFFVSNLHISAGSAKTYVPYAVRGAGERTEDTRHFLVLTFQLKSATIMAKFYIFREA